MMTVHPSRGLLLVMHFDQPQTPTESVSWIVAMALPFAVDTQSELRLLTVISTRLLQVQSLATTAVTIATYHLSLDRTRPSACQPICESENTIASFQDPECVPGFCCPTAHHASSSGRLS